MNAILGMTHLALDMPAGDKQRNLLRTVEHSADILLHLLDDILDFSKMEAGQLRLNQVPFDLRCLIEGVLSVMNVPAAEKGLRLAAVVPEGLPLCFVGDELRLRQILVNLVNNGIKFTEAGAITIGVALEGEAMAEGTVALHLSVADTGIGIVAEKLPRIFDRFEQADNSYARQYGGVGLGLAICQQLVALMGGLIWAESPGRRQGSTFHLIVPLPLCAEDELPVKVVANGEAREIKGLRILVVDDNEVNREVAGMTLAPDHTVVTADNGLEALRHLAAESFDVVLMDVQMPVMDGLSATGVIRAAERGEPFAAGLPEGGDALLARRLGGGHLPLVAMTAHALGGDREICLEAGMDAYLTKPFHPEQLKAVLATLLVDVPEVAGERTETAAVEPDAVPAPLPPQPTMAGVRAHLQDATLLKPEQIELIVAAALRSLTDNLALAEEALAQGDRTTLGRAAHTLKGTLLQCGLDGWAERAQAIHTGVREDRELPYAAMVAEIKQAMASLWRGEL